MKFMNVGYVNYSDSPALKPQCANEMIDYSKNIS